MSKIRIALTVLAFLLFIIVNIFTNDEVKTHVASANTIVMAAGISSVILTLISVLLLYKQKRV